MPLPNLRSVTLQYEYRAKARLSEASLALCCRLRDYIQFHEAYYAIQSWLSMGPASRFEKYCLLIDQYASLMERVRSRATIAQALRLFEEMNLKQLSYFVTIVESRSMTRAATLRHIAQPALSQQVAQLESEFGMRLLTRSVRGVIATEAGMLLYQHAKGILRQVEVTQTVLRQNAAHPTGRVTLAMPSSVTKVVAIPLLCEARTRYPGISLELIEGPSADLRGLVVQGRADLAITIGDTPEKGLVETPLLLETLYLLSHPDVPLPNRPLTVADLSEFKFMFPGLPNTIRSTTERVFAEANISLNVVAEISAASLLVSAVAHGLGATILPWSTVLEEVKSGQVRMSHVQIPGMERQLTLCHAEFLPLSPASELIADLLMEQLHAQVASGRWQGVRWLGAGGSLGFVEGGVGGADDT